MSFLDNHSQNEDVQGFFQIRLRIKIFNLSIDPTKSGDKIKNSSQNGISICMFVFFTRLKIFA